MVEDCPEILWKLERSFKKAKYEASPFALGKSLRCIFTSFWLGVLILSVPPLGAQMPGGKTAVIECSAQGNIELDEGTLEIYIRTGFDTEKIAGLYTIPLFELVSPATSEKAFISYVVQSHRFAMVGQVKPVPHAWVISHPEGTPGIKWKAGEHHVIALTWKGNHRQFFIDGVASDDTKVEGPLVFNLAKSLLRFGAPANGFWTLDEIRISSVRRTPAELKEGVDRPPQADPYTLLLDHFDTENPAVMQGNVGNQKRQLEGPLEKVNGKFGGALKLWSGS